jgi:hypothetical protein
LKVNFGKLKKKKNMKILFTIVFILFIFFSFEINLNKENKYLVKKKTSIVEQKKKEFLFYNFMKIKIKDLENFIDAGFFKTKII